MREIEVKAKLRDRAGFLAAANKLGITFGAALTQDDTTYEADLPYDHPGWSIFRLRKQDDKNILTMKHKASSRSRDNHEYETAIDNAAEMVKILNRLGYVRGVHLRKQRRVAHYNDLELCLDEIESLGTFVEAEKLVSDQADVDKVQAELWALLLQLGISPEDRVYKGYDTLMRSHHA